MQCDYVSVRAGILLLCACVSAYPFSASGGSFEILPDEGKQVVVVLADTPSRTARFAAAELTNHVYMATDISLRIVSEADAGTLHVSRIFLGDTQTARKIGINPDSLGPDEFVIRTVGKDLFILGQEDADMPPLQGVYYSHGQLPSAYVNPYGGTLFAVYEFLSRFVGVRWLWPGHLGTYVPRSSSISINADINEKQGPRLKFRLWGWSHIWQAEAYEKRVDELIRKLAFSSEGIVRYRNDLELYLRRHRLGVSEVCPHGVHTFHWWWKRYGNKNPEWFMLNSEGERGPEEGKDKSMMCISNPDLQNFIVERYNAGNLYVTGWAPADRVKYAGFIPLGETDNQGRCLCDGCRAWDDPQPEELPEHALNNKYHFRNIYNPLQSNRYARFWKSIYDLAAQDDPEVRIGVYLYWNTFPAPSTDIKLNPNIWGEFAPWISRESYFPMPETAEQWMKDQWLGWRNTGMTMVYRPNYFHCGYVMPHFSTWQAGEFFRWAWENGMAATSFDSLYGHWSVRGPMIYMLMRLFWNPELEIDLVRAEYFSGFGPAAEIVESYFDYWENFSQSRSGGWLHSDVARVNDAFPPDCFPPAEEILSEALQEAEKDTLPEFAERIRFLQAGLRHARLAANFMETLNPEPKGTRRRVPEDGSEGFQAARLALEELINFRRAHESDYLSDYLDAARREQRAVLEIERIIP